MTILYGSQIIPLATASEAGKAHHVNLCNPQGCAKLWSEEVLSAKFLGQVSWKRTSERVKLLFLSGNFAPWHMLSMSRVSWYCSSNLVVNSV